MNPLESLAAIAGSRAGSNTLQDPFSGQPEETPSELTITPVLDGRFVRVDYTWAYRGAPQSGSILLGFEPKTAAVSGYWIDSWHMGHAALTCPGTATADGGIVLRGSYPAPPGPDWGWRITVATAGDAIRITHTNLEPDGSESPAVDGVYPRG